MFVLVVLAAVAVASAAPLAVVVVVGGRASGFGMIRRAVNRNLTTGLAAPTDVRGMVLARPVGERAIQPLLASLASSARRLTPAGVLRSLDHRLQLAGEAWPVERVLAAKLGLAAAAAGGGVLWLWLAPVTAGAPLSILLVPAAGLAGWIAPDAVVAGRADDRQQRILDELPDTLDQLTICVEAGLGFDSALARIAQTGRGPLGVEIGRVLTDVQIGIPRSEALQRLLERTDVAELRQFVHAIHQAEEYGVPVAAVLQSQAAEQRQRRCSRAEERAQKLPVKLVFPLVLCILPALFVVVLGPAALRASRLFG